MTPSEIREGRKKLGLSQPALAELLQVPVGTLRGWEYGRRAPEAAALTLLRIVLQMRIWQVQAFVDDQIFRVGGTFLCEDAAQKAADKMRKEIATEVPAGEVKVVGLKLA
ncbi:MAG: helix-turn-helix domain-containing protein [Rhodospirillales bacterium]|nr:helix-turn-helix domain-containing protein [Rhodospirillales bacterium]